MGRMLGAYDPNSVIDRPDLNKCPDCECFFASINCPICGKVCPEDMRAGNRKPVKIKKQKNSGTGRVTFVEWYHSWWFILLMLFIFPIAGICLLVTSPHKKWAKILFGVLFALYTVGISYGGFGLIAGMFEGSPVDDSLTYEEYVAACETVSPETYYRAADSFEDKFVTMDLRVIKKITAYDDSYTDYITYYLCTSVDGKYEILVRNCFLGDVQNLTEGDRVTVYGEGAGNGEIDSANYETYSAPILNGAYAEIN